jgi:hypothetical protein
MKIKTTVSLCPECLKPLKAEIFEKGGKVYIKKECKKHGRFQDLYWEDYDMYKKASTFSRDGPGITNPQVKKKNIKCPMDCGICSHHLSHTGLANVVVTNRCDLACFYCFFYAKEGDRIYEPTLEQFRNMFRILKNQKPVPNNAVQITGGEPCLRDDLLDILRMVKEEDFDHVQLNTNGVRLAQDLGFVKKLKGLVNTIYMSFDGVTPQTNPKNHWEAPQAIENCKKAGIGVVLVPTVIRGVNDHELGDIIRFGFQNIGVVRGVNFQPVSLVGRMPRRQREKQRITIPGTIKRIEEQTNGEIAREDFYPVPSVSSITKIVEAFSETPKYNLTTHFACGMATYVFKDGDKIIPITRFVDVEGLFEYLEDMAKEINNGKSRTVAKVRLLYNIRKYIDREKQPKGLGLGKILMNALLKRNYEGLREFHHRALYIGMMHFQDLYNYDVERVRRCCVHYAVPDGRVIPFCAFNVIPQIYRDKIQERFSVPQKQWEKQTGKTLKSQIYKRRLSNADFVCPECKARENIKVIKGYKQLHKCVECGFLSVLSY